MGQYLLPAQTPIDAVLEVTLQNSSNLYWRSDTSVFEARNDAHWAAYTISTDNDAGDRSFDKPSGLPTTQSYRMKLWPYSATALTADQILYEDTAFDFEGDTGAGSQTVSDFHDNIRRNAREGQSDAMYTPADVAFYAQAIVDRFLKNTRAYKKVAQLTLSEGASTLVDVFPSDFRPENAELIYLFDEDDLPTEAVTKIGIEDLLDELRRCGTNTGAPTKLAFEVWTEDSTKARFNKTADQAYAVNIRYIPAIVLSESDEDEIALPAQFMSFLAIGASALMQQNSPEHSKEASERWAKYLEWENSMRGANSDGASSSVRDAAW